MGSDNEISFHELRQKEVINTKDGSRLGYVCDLVFNTDCGKITELIVPGPSKLFGLMGKEQEYHIAWDDVDQIGDDVILVDIDTKKALVDCG